MQMKKKRLDSSSVSRQLWKAANISPEGIRNYDLLHPVTSSNAPQERSQHDKTKAVEFSSLASLSSEPNFAFNSIRGRLQINAPCIIGRKDRLIAHGPLKQDNKSPRPLADNLNVEVPIVPDLYQFKKRIVSSKLIQKKIENNEYLMMILGKKQKQLDATPKSRLLDLRSRLKSAFPNKALPFKELQPQSNGIQRFSINSGQNCNRSLLQSGRKSQKLSTNWRVSVVTQSENENQNGQSLNPSCQRGPDKIVKGQNQEVCKIKIKFDPSPSTATVKVDNGPYLKNTRAASSKPTVVSHNKAAQELKNLQHPSAQQNYKGTRPALSATSNPCYHYANPFSDKRGDKERIPRPSSSIQPLMQASQMFYQHSKVSALSPANADSQQLQPIFDFCAKTAFVSLVFKENKVYVRPSDRIGLYIQDTENLCSAHISYISTLQRGTSFSYKSIPQIPLQFSLLEVFNESRQPRDKGICHYIAPSKMLECVSYSIFPEFISTWIFVKEKIPFSKIEPSEENDRRFVNRSLYFEHLLVEMKGTYDPAYLVDRYYAKRYKEVASVNPADVCQILDRCSKSYERYHAYCDEKYIPKDKIPPFPRETVAKVLKCFPESLLKEKDVQIREFFREIFCGYVASQRKAIIAYLLKSKRERERLGVHFLPENNGLTSNEIITRCGGYHKKIFTSWSSAYGVCREVLNKQELQFKAKTLAIKNWLSEFEKIPLFEAGFCTAACQWDLIPTVHNFIKFQGAYLDVFESFGEQFIKRGLVCLIDGDFYLKPVKSTVYGSFSLLQYTQLKFAAKDKDGATEAQLQRYMEEVFSSAHQKDSVNMIDLYGKALRKMRSELALNFRSARANEDASLALDCSGRVCSPQELLKKVDPYHRDELANRMIKVFCYVLEDFIVNRTVSCFNEFYEFLQKRLAGVSQSNNEFENQSLINLELRFEEGRFYLDDSWDVIENLLNLYFDQQFNAFNFLYDLLDYTVVFTQEASHDASFKKKKKMKSTGGAKVEEAELVKEFALIYQEYMPQIVLQQRSSDEEEIIAEVSKRSHVNYSTFLDKARTVERIKEDTVRVRQSILSIFDSEYKKVLEVLKDFSKFQAVISKSWETNEFPDFMKSQKTNVVLFSSLVKERNKNMHASQLSLATDKLKKEEILSLKKRINSFLEQINSMSPARYFPIFKLRCHNVVASIHTYLREIDDRLSKRVVERVILNSRVFLSRYQKLTDLLRKDVTCSGDYAWLRAFSVEVGQEKQILLRRAKEIYEDFDFYMSIKAAKVNATEVLENLYELSLADKALEEEIENALERGYMRKVEFECKLKEQKVAFQADCDDLLYKVQILKTINDIRNSIQYFEEVQQLSLKLEELKNAFQLIDRAEMDIYERNYKTNLFVELDDLILTNLEVWKAVNQSLAFIKKTNLIHVAQLKVEPIESFITETTSHYSNLVSNGEIWAKDNLRVILVDFKHEFDEFASHLNIIRLVCTKELTLAHWKEYFAALVTDFDFQFFNLKIFISLYSQENQAAFESLCAKAIMEERLRQVFGSYVEIFNGLRLEISDKESQIYFESTETILRDLNELAKNIQSLLEDPNSEFAREEIACFSAKPQKLITMIPMISRIQEKAEKIKALFASVEYKAEMEQAYQLFLSALSFNQEMKDIALRAGVIGLEAEPGMFEKVVLNLSRLEIIENHHSHFFAA